MSNWPLVSLPDMLRLERRPVLVEPNGLYAEIGVYCFGRGIFHKAPRTGSEVGDKKLFLIREGDFILQITFAWEGAVAIATEAENGMYASTRFPTFQVDQKQCYPQFLLNYFRTREGKDQLVKISPGSAGRNRVLSLKRLNEVFVPLPSLEEQRRVVDKVEKLSQMVGQLTRQHSQAHAEADVLYHSVVDRLFQQPAGCTVSDYARIQSGYAFKSHWFSEQGVRLARNVNIGHGVIDWRDVARLPHDQTGPFDRFVLNEGDILISLDRPIISTGVKVARVRECDLPSLLLQRVGRVCFTSDGVLPDYFYAWLRSGHFVRALDPGRSNGVPHISPKDVERIPFAAPSLSEQRAVLAEIQNLNPRFLLVRRLQNEISSEIRAILPSVLQEAFARGV